MSREKIPVPHRKCAGCKYTCHLPNFPQFSGYKDAHLTSHWENTLSCAIELEKWLAQQEKVAEQIDKQLNSKLEGELHFLALDMRDHVAAVSSFPLLTHCCSEFLPPSKDPTGYPALLWGFRSCPFAPPLICIAC